MSTTPQGGQASQDVGGRPPGRVSRSQEDRGSGAWPSAQAHRNARWGGSLQRSPPQTWAGAGPAPPQPSRCPELAMRLASVHVNQPGGTWRASRCSDREHRLGSGRQTTSVHNWGCSRRKTRAGLGGSCRQQSEVCGCRELPTAPPARLPCRQPWLDDYVEHPWFFLLGGTHSVLRSPWSRVECSVSWWGSRCVGKHKKAEGRLLCFQDLGARSLEGSVVWPPSRV